MCMCLAQGGSGFPFLAKCVFEYICGKDINDIKIDMNDVHDAGARDILQKDIFKPYYCDSRHMNFFSGS